MNRAKSDALTSGILVIRGGAIGDFILTLPALAALRERFPAARLEVLGYPHIAQLALAGGVVDAVRSIEAGALAGFFARNGTLDAGLRDYFAGFAVIVSYLFDPDGIFAGNVAQCSKAEFIAGPHRPRETAGIHATRVYLQPLERLAIFDADPVPRLRLQESPRDRRPETAAPSRPIPPRVEGARVLALHPGSGSERKNWPESNWARLLEALAEVEDLRFLLVGGEAEGDRLDRLAARLPGSRLRVARSLPLTDLARRLATCAAFLGHDSGITHLAAALGLPTRVLWGETAAAIWRPQGGEVALLRDEGGLAALTVRAVEAGVLELLDTGKAAR
jgi:heptosyltransferase III